MPGGRQIRHGQARDLGGVRSLQVLTVHPRELVLVEDAGAVSDIRELESGREFRRGQHFLVVPRRPPDQRQIVQERFRQVPLVAELRNRGGTVAFRERTVVRTEHQREMRERRRFVPERLVEQQLPRRVRDVVLAADHVGHTHQRVIHDHREVVRRMPIRSHQHGIADDAGLERHLTRARRRRT